MTFTCMLQKITHLTPFYSPHIGGVETHVSELNVELLKRGKYSVTVLTQQHATELPRKEKIAGVAVVRLQGVSDLLEAKSFLAKLVYKCVIWVGMFRSARLLFESDVIHVHDVFWWLLPLYPFLKLRGKKIVTTFHGWEGKYPIPFFSKLQRSKYNALSHGVLHVGAWIQELYGDEPNSIVYGGIPSQSKPFIVLPNEFGMRHYPYTFVFIGRLEKVNEIESYIQLVKLLTTSHFKPRVLWVGDGSLREACEQVGEVVGNQTDILPFLQRAKFVFANSYLSMLAAQAVGKIVLSFYSTRLKRKYLEAYPGYAHCIVAHKPTALAERMAVPLQFSLADLTKKSETIMAFAKTQTWAKVADEYEWLWQR